MTDETGVTSGGEAIFTTELPADAPESFNSPREAAEYFTSLKAKKAQPAESAKEATAEKELPDEGSAESPETETISEDQADEPAKPAIDPPKSWTKDLHDHWANLDPVLQERIVARDREDQAAIKRAFNEAADDRKAVKAEREAAEKVRQQYEAQLPALMQSLQDAQQSSFADIKTMADVEKLQNEDPFRFQAWQVQQMRLQAVSAENERARTSQTQKQQSEWTQYVQKENELASEYIPELADKAKGPALMQRAAERLNELGFKPEELAKLASGQEKLSVYDHRIQRLIFSDLKLTDIQSAKTAVAAKSVPPVQRPGTSKPSGSTVSEKLQALESKFNKTGKLSDAQALYAAQLESQSRRRAS